MAQQFDTAIMIVTHDEKIIPTFKRLYNIREGLTVEEIPKGISLPASAVALFESDTARDKV